MTGQIHHLNCGTLNPFSSRLLYPSAGLSETRFLVTHCLLIETAKGLILIDSGLGRKDIERTDISLGKHRTLVTQPALLKVECAINQVERLGYSRDDVRHIVLTHMDFLQTGGLSDFPNASIHTMRKEFEAANTPQTVQEKWRYSKQHWQHSAKWVLHSFTGGLWKGLEFSPVFPESDEVLMISLPGHSRDHIGVAIRKQQGWLLHCGDAILDSSTLNNGGLSLTKLLSAAMDCCRADRLHTLQKLATLASNEQDVQFVCSLDPDCFHQYRFSTQPETPEAPESQLSFPLQEESSVAEAAL
ncbi:MBL fold metallo-hydrolase [Litoribacillus peritrichatus]|uniref:MBL fold metallo-hydrolase n=1 Tax=Litoribacillus peritrichatus TaxID=718191 RepID=A0ABP7M4U2_9GAMM